MCKLAMEETVSLKTWLSKIKTSPFIMQTCKLVKSWCKGSPGFTYGTVITTSKAQVLWESNKELLSCNCMLFTLVPRDHWRIGSEMTKTTGYRRIIITRHNCGTTHHMSFWLFISSYSTINLLQNTCYEIQISFFYLKLCLFDQYNHDKCENRIESLRIFMSSNHLATITWLCGNFADQSIKGYIPYQMKQMASKSG